MSSDSPDTLRRAEFRVLVCGDRWWWDERLIYATLDTLHERRPISCIIEGEARGADKMARRWAEDRGIDFDPYPANWRRYGKKAAGPIRNRKQFDEGKPDLVLAFHDDIGKSRGTKDMLAYAEAMGCQTRLVSHTNGNEGCGLEGKHGIGMRCAVHGIGCHLRGVGGEE